MSEETTNKINPAEMADTETDTKLTTTSNGDTEQTQVTKTNSSNVSEYDSADSYSNRENGSLSGSESDGSVIFEREEGDGQESTPAKKVDDDEDKKNPQYIPKRGTFYEHDDRTADDIESPEAEKNDKDGKKKVWQDKKEKWSHDRFNDNEQAPKSRAELIAIYGYDIRNEDGPPRARRRRRYGRGPNKYTRNWEDVDAYGKPTVIRKTTTNKKRRPKSQASDSDSRDQNKSVQDEEEEDTPETVSPVESPQQQAKDQRVLSSTNEENKSNLPPPVQQHQQQQHYQQQHQQPSQHRETPRQNNISTHQNDNKHQYPQQQQPNKNFRAGSGRVSKPKREITDSDYRGFTKSRQFKSTPANRVHGRNNQNSNLHQGNKGIQEVEKDMGKMSIQDGGGGGGFKQNIKHNNSRQGSMPPRLQAEQKGSKRYSSIRQRSLPETTNPPFPQHANYYGNGNN
ncbi:protein casc3 [Holotrichia oblita]|uniref:Protein casc3 n=1 Tax=Holotrichia oblita TaxID=644536 RepID=A0ACB9TQ90_HOLOL|nr:protein casc3 [Holotrichia oblita]